MVVEPSSRVQVTPQLQGMWTLLPLEYWYVPIYIFILYFIYVTCARKALGKKFMPFPHTGQFFILTFIIQKVKFLVLCLNKELLGPQGHYMYFVFEFEASRDFFLMKKGR